MTRMFSPAVRCGSVAFGSVRWSVFGIIGAHGHVLGTDHRTLFNRESLDAARRPLADFDAAGAAAGLAVLRDWCASYDTQLLLMIVPDKATIYCDLLPPRYQDGLAPAGAAIRALHRALDAQGGSVCGSLDSV